jgi:hypothetical protein
MVGGERERKGKRKEARFSDRPRPKPSKAELKHSLLKKEGFELLKSKGTAFKYCPFDGQLLVGRLAKCSKCDQVFGQKLLVGKGASENACLVDVRDYHVAWRRKVFWRMIPPFHSGVVWVTGPPVPVAAFESIFGMSLLVDSYFTSAVRTTIRKLETTRAVEDFCRFENVEEAKGLGAAKLLSSGSILYLVPPVDVVHTDSKVAGSRVTLTYGWVILTAKGNIVKAEGMETPAEGWEHVEARVRDAAASMRDCFLSVSPEIVDLSEQISLEQAGGDEDKSKMARIARDDDEAHFTWPRDGVKTKAVVRAPVPALYAGIPKQSSFSEAERTAEEVAGLYPLYRNIFTRDAEGNGHAAVSAGECMVA